MTTKETLNPDEEVETNPQEESESEETSEDLDSLFDDDSQEKSDDKKEESDDDKIARLEKTVENLKKGVAKAFSEKGRKKEEPKEAKEVSEPNSVIKNLYFKANPEATLIWDEVEKEAKNLGKNPFELYENSAYLKGEAKSRAEAKENEEKSKSKISKPSTDVDFSKKVSSIKEEDLGKLTPAQKVEWIKAKVAEEKANIE